MIYAHHCTENSTVLMKFKKKLSFVNKKNIIFMHDIEYLENRNNFMILTNVLLFINQAR